MTKGLTGVPIKNYLPAMTIKERINLNEELLLPDYCPDIGRIIFLKCRSAVSSVSFQDKNMDVSGIVSLCLIYESCDGLIKKADYAVPFKKDFSLKEGLNEADADIKTSSCTASYKLLSQRRLEADISFTLDGTVFDAKDTEVIEKSEIPDIILREEKEKYLVPFDKIEELVPFSEEIMLPSDKPEVSELLSCDIEAFPEKVSPAGDDVCLSASLLLHSLYVPVNGNDKIESFDAVIPMSKKFNSLNLKDDFSFAASAKVLSVNLEKTEDEGHLLLECEINCRLSLFAPSERLLAVDGFSPSYSYEKLPESPNVIKSAESFSKEEHIEGDIPAPSEVRSIEDAEAEVKSISLIDEDVKKCFCDVEFSVLYKNADGKYASLKNVVKSVTALPEAGKKDRIHADGFITSPNVSLYNGRLKLSCDMTVKGSIIRSEKLPLLGDIKLFEDKPVSKISGYSMVIYYADEGDDLWNIGKKYKVDPERVKVENSLENEEFKERTPLIIPLD